MLPPSVSLFHCSLARFSVRHERGKTHTRRTLQSANESSFRTWKARAGVRIFWRASRMSRKSDDEIPSGWCPGRLQSGTACGSVPPDPAPCHRSAAVVPESDGTLTGCGSACHHAAHDPSSPATAGRHAQSSAGPQLLARRSADLANVCAALD